MDDSDSLGGTSANFNSAGEYLDDLLGPMNGGYVARVEEDSEESIDVQHTGEGREGEEVVPDATVLWSDRPSAGNNRTSVDTRNLRYVVQLQVLSMARKSISAWLIWMDHRRSAQESMQRSSLSH
ncbi:hypothetical protein LTR12_016141 [Friedmanniomyces endolithicus]|nr:hypothetical protein LTR74_018797 [Friedmanniomyces endolithicus]KAK1809517.1 hypothetical protein LTR12_016141 [Friedmanniomyces endolithicus]